jgi:hypothetical protein
VIDPPPELLATPKEYGRESYSVEELQSSLALGSWAFLQDDGFPALQARLQELDPHGNSLLVIDDDLFEKKLHQFRWYLGLHRDVEAYYLGTDYSEPYDYLLSSEYTYDRPALFILPHGVDAVACSDPLSTHRETVANHNGLPKFLLCK